MPYNQEQFRWPSTMQQRARLKTFSASRSLASVLSLCAVLALPGCMLRDAYRQMGDLEGGCIIAGTVEGERTSAGPIVVAVVESTDSTLGSTLHTADHFVLNQPGRWVFGLAPGQYRILLFQSQDGSLAYQATDPMLVYPDEGPIDCPAGKRYADKVLNLDQAGVPEVERLLTLERGRQGLGQDLHMAGSIGQLTAFGTVTDLSDPRFDARIARDSQWRPLDFLLNGYMGIYFLEEYDPERVPVLFVHGMNGSPGVFHDLVQDLDRERFQAWFYYYPSGLSPSDLADHLANTMLELELRHAVDQLHVVAHSMGGLLARAFLLRREERGSVASVGAFIPLSTPWGGHDAAGRAVDSSPIVLPVWRDMAPGSAFIESLFQPDAAWPAEAEKYLLFSYRPDGYVRFGQADDGVISLASLLRPEAQASASAMVGFDTTHSGILSESTAIERVHAILEASTPPARSPRG